MESKNKIASEALKKEDVSKNLSLEEEMVRYSNEVLNIKVYSVALPTNFNPESKNKDNLLVGFKKKV